MKSNIKAGDSYSQYEKLPQDPVPTTKVDIDLLSNNSPTKNKKGAFLSQDSLAVSANQNSKLIKFFRPAASSFACCCCSPVIIIGF